MQSRLRKFSTALLVTSVVIVWPSAEASSVTGTVEGEWWYESLKIEQNHRIANGAGVTIALIDGPVLTNVPELQGQRIEAGGAYCHGLTSPLLDAEDSYHATSMAAVMVGSGRGTRANGTGLRGIAPGATLRLYAIDDGRDKSRFACPQDAEGLDDGVTDKWRQALRDAVDDGADIVAMPLTLRSSNDEAVRYAHDRGVLVVAAAGEIFDGDGRPENDSVGCPACMRGVIAATAVDKTGRQFAQAPRGKQIVVAAPGVEVAAGSVDARGKWSSSGTWSGTSFSTAYIAGMLAVVKSRYPNATAAQLVQHLVRNTTNETVRWDDTYGYGIASLTRMLASDPAAAPDDNPLLQQAAGDVDLRRWTQPADAPPQATVTVAADGQAPAGQGVLYATVTLLVAIGICLLWRWRRRN